MTGFRRPLGPPARALLSVLAGLAVATTLLAGGCSGGDDDAGRTPAATAAAAPGATLADVPEIVDQVQPSIVAVLVSGSRGQGEGSGVIWSPDGLIVTNDHVVDGARDITVALASGERLGARVVATDPRSDLAVIRVDREGLPAADFAEDLPEVGELAVALGSPLGFENTATAGIVSGLHRSIPTGGTTPALIDLVQTDAAISPGNSGGALVGGDRRVIGVNVAYIPPSQSAVAIGFAIPAPTVRSVVTQLLASGEVQHAYLGLRPAPNSAAIAQRFGLSTDTGALVVSVDPGTPAARAGIREGDVIVALGGDEVEQVEDLFAALRGREPGDRVDVTIVRDGRRRQVAVTLGRLP